jgi:cysteine-rich repeat protein
VIVCVEYISSNGACEKWRMGGRFLLIITFLLIGGCCVDTVAGVCTDGILDEHEECDDGNANDSDGCNTTCFLEDPDVWLCISHLGEISICCPLLVNPWTLDVVCDCVDAQQPDPIMGYTITRDCHRHDIDECLNANPCHVLAYCTNIDKSLSDEGTALFECRCLPGFVGDGVRVCDRWDGFSIISDGENVPASEYPTSADGFANISNGDNEPSSEYPTSADGFANISDGDNESSSEYPTSAEEDFEDFKYRNHNARRLLDTQTGLEVTITIVSTTADAMTQLTGEINTTALPLDYVLTSAPFSTVLVNGAGLVNTRLYILTPVVATHPPKPPTPETIVLDTDSILVPVLLLVIIVLLTITVTLFLNYRYVVITSGPSFWNMFQDIPAGVIPHPSDSMFAGISHENLNPRRFGQTIRADPR